MYVFLFIRKILYYKYTQPLNIVPPLMAIVTWTFCNNQNNSVNKNENEKTRSTDNMASMAVDYGKEKNTAGDMEPHEEQEDEEQEQQDVEEESADMNSDDHVFVAINPTTYFCGLGIWQSATLVLVICVMAFSFTTSIRKVQSEISTFAESSKNSASQALHSFALQVTQDASYAVALLNSYVLQLWKNQWGSEDHEQQERLPASAALHSAAELVKDNAQRMAQVVQDETTANTSAVALLVLAQIKDLLADLPGPKQETHHHQQQDQDLANPDSMPSPSAPSRDLHKQMMAEMMEKTQAFQQDVVEYAVQVDSLMLHYYYILIVALCVCVVLVQWLGRIQSVWRRASDEKQQ